VCGVSAGADGAPYLECRDIDPILSATIPLSRCSRWDATILFTASRTTDATDLPDAAATRSRSIRSETVNRVSTFSVDRT
jgi:hypothetical protein